MSKAGDWRCPCGTNNFAKRLACMECHRAITTDHPGDWWCPHCHVTNFSYRTECKTCQRPKPVTPSWDQTPPPATKWKEGDWRCPCGTVNFASRSACFKCGLSKAPQTSGVGDATNQQQSQSNASTTGSDPKPTAAPPQGKPGDWNCHCGTLNFAHRSACFKCNAPKGAVPSQQQQQGGSPPPPPSASLPSAINSSTGAAPMSDRKPGDWNCPQCSFVNFGSRRVCMKCGTENPATTSPPPASLAPSAVGKAAVVDPNGAAVGLPAYFAPPAYWRLSTSPVPPATSKGGVPSLYEVYDDSSMEAMVRQLFATDAPSLKVAQVRRLENPVLWQSYRAECGRLVAKYGDRGCQPLPPQVAPTTLLKYLKDDLKINEVLLMHGTSPEVGLTIMNNGFDPSHSGEASGSLYGQGTYFSDSLKKVLQYSKGCILVSRVALGEPALPPFQSPHTFRRPPVKPAGTAGTSGAPDEYDCVIGGSTYKEFIVYRHTKAYPEFVIFHGA